MGLPDFLKFAVRSAPDSLTPVSRNAKHGHVIFDFALIDATNAAQTIGFDQLFELLVNSNITIRVAIIFAVDSQRDRSGTARHHRQSRAVAGDLDVKVQEFCSRVAKALTSRNGTSNVPLLLMSGRGVAGEADYKILDIQRSIVASALFYKKRVPTFLFVSEDSDILCGTMCGPAPQNVSIATSLHDTTFNVNLLRLSHVVTYVAACVDALAEEVEEDLPHTEVVPTLELPPPQDDDDDVVRRRKKDGPMVATGTRVVLDSTDSDNDEDTPTRQEGHQSQSSLGVSTLSVSTLDLAAGWITYSSCVDLVFLFQLIMGNGINVPPLVRGVTKVDVQSCWAAYCRNKYNASAGPNGRTLLKMVHSSADSTASLAVDGALLYSILESVHYTDCVSRPPVGEEKERATEFLSNAAYGTLRYIVGCNIDCGVSSGTEKKNESFLDSRTVVDATNNSPSLAAIMWVLGSGASLTFNFSLLGKPEAATTGTGMSSSTNSVRHSSTEDYFSVTDHLFAPQISTSWAVRGAGSKEMTLDEVLRNNVLTGIKYPLEKLSVGQKIVRSLKDALKDLQAPPTEYRSAGGVFSSLIVHWALSVSKVIPHLRQIGASTRFLSPATGKIVVGPARRGNDPGRSLGVSSNTRMTYSFELRRMTPVLDDSHQDGKNEDKGNSVEGSSASQQALLKALGVSLDYASKPQSMISIKSPTTPPMKRKKVEKKGDAEEETSLKAAVPKDASGGKKRSRPGKKERMRRRPLPSGATDPHSKTE